MQMLTGISWHFQKLQFFSLDPRTQSSSKDTKWKIFASHSHHLSSVPCSCLPASLSVLFPKQTMLAPLRDHSFRPESYKPSCSATIELWWAALRRPRWTRAHLRTQRYLFHQHPGREESQNHYCHIQKPSHQEAEEQGDSRQDSKLEGISPSSRKALTVLYHTTCTNLNSYLFQQLVLPNYI